MTPKRPRRSSGKHTVLRARCRSASAGKAPPESSQRRIFSSDQRWSRLNSIAFIEMSRWQSKIRRGGGGGGMGGGFVVGNRRSGLRFWKLCSGGGLGGGKSENFLLKNLFIL